jgi:hypothetical protein
MPVRPTFTSGQVFTAAEANTLALPLIALNAQTGTTYTVALTDVGKLVTITNGSPITLTIPTNATVAFAIGDQINIAQFGAGVITIAGAVGVTVRSNGSKLKTNGQYAVATVVKIGTDEWLALGNLVP